ncbi:MAG: CPBP family intramembrane glutamic endopeptidase [Candidatus Limnocylindrales bacterium]
MTDAPERSLAESGAVAGVSALARLRAWLVDAPGYPADAADLRTVEFLGLRMPRRATTAVMLVALLLLLDYHGRVTDLVAWATGWSTTSDAEFKRIQGVGRLVLLGGVPLLVVLLGFRDRPSRYGLRLGDWRAGLAIILGGIAVMTPVAFALAHVPAFAAYYAPQAAPPPQVFLTTALDVLPAEFFFRGFLLFALLRAVGPVAVVVATLPFAFSHLGKPELETLSTLGGGFLYGWLDWRTGSVLWSGLAHTCILGCMVLASAAVGMPGH